MTNFEFKVGAVKELEDLYKALQKKCKKDLKSIEEEGISRHYSVNSEILEIAFRIHKISTILGYINTFNLEFLDKEKK